MSRCCHPRLACKSKQNSEGRYRGLIEDIYICHLAHSIDFEEKSPLIMWSKVLIRYVDFISAGSLFHVFLPHLI